MNDSNERTNDRLKALRERMAAAPRVLRVEPKGFHPVMIQTEQQIKNLEIRLNLPRCSQCGLRVIVGENEGAALRDGKCYQCSVASPKDAA